VVTNECALAVRSRS